MLYLIHGDDTFRSNQFLKKILEKSGKNSVVFLEGIRVDLENLNQLLETIPLFGQRKLIVIKNLISDKKNRVLEKDLVKYLGKVKADLNCIFYESQKIARSGPLFQFVSQGGKVKEFKSLNRWKLKKWIEEEIKSQEASSDKKTIDLLVEFFGNNLWTLKNEIEKLCLFVGKRKITAEDVGSLTGVSSQATIFELVDGLGYKDHKICRRLFYKLLNQGETPEVIFAMFIRQIRLILFAKELLKEKKEKVELANLLKVPPFVASKIYSQARNFDLKQLNKIYDLLIETDWEIKTGQKDPITALDLLIGEIVTI